MHQYQKVAKGKPTQQVPITTGNQSMQQVPISLKKIYSKYQLAKEKSIQQVPIS